LARDQASYEKQQRRKAEIEQFVRRFKAKASKAKQAQSRVKELERMEELAPAHVDSPFDFVFPVPERFSDPLLSLSDAQLGYDQSAPVLRGINLSIHPGSRIGLLGANGAGKSTLIKSLMAELPLIVGQRTEGEHLSVGYFSQHQIDSLDMSASPVLLIQRLSSQATEQDIRNFLGSFDFRGDRVKEEIKLFSGGEKARLALAAIVWQKPNLLLLDEPTNHLDLEMCHALTVALQGFEGAVVLVSHDRHLVKNCVDQLILVTDGAAAPFEGDLEDYSRWLLSRLKEERNQSSQSERTESGESADRGKSSQEESRQDKKKLRQEAADLRRQLAPLKKKVARIEQEISELDRQLAKVEEELADTSLYDAENKDRLQKLLKLQGSLTRDKDDKEALWCELVEELESKEAEIGQ
jgi:ATP-binding cassette subfamily F protein 3